jgi:eukaryotic-like serine/threonine-protein kinase
VPAPRRRGRRRRAAFVAAAASVVVVAGASGVAIAGLESGPRPAGPAVAAPAPVLPAPPTGLPALPPAGASPAPSTAEPVPSSAPAPASPDAPVGDDEAVRTVTDYYGGLPGDPDRAWAVLSGSARDDSGGYDGYRRFWDGITSVTASGVRAEDGTVRADIDFVTDGGRTSREQYRFRLGRDDDGRVVITSAQRSADAM